MLKEKRRIEGEVKTMFALMNPTDRCLVIAQDESERWVLYMPNNLKDTALNDILVESAINDKGFAEAIKNVAAIIRDNEEMTKLLMGEQSTNLPEEEFDGIY